MPRPLLFLLPCLILFACGGARPTVEARPEPEGHGATASDADHRARVMRAFMDATRARLAGDMATAVQLYNATLQLDPKNAAAMYELAKLYHAAQQMAPALDFARKAQQTDRDNIWYRFLLADLCIEAGKPEEAAAVYKGVVQQWPDRYEVYFDLADALAQAGKVAEARKVYDDLEKRIGSDEEIVMNEFDMLANANALTEARALLEEAIAKEPDNTQYRVVIAELYDHLGQHDLALAQYEELLRRDPADNMVRVSLAEHYFGTGQMDKAFEHLQVAFADPDLDIDPKMQLLLGFYEMTGRSAMPQEEKDKLMENSYSLITLLQQAHPSSGKPFSIEGDFRLRDGQLEAAREAFRKAAALEPDKFPIHQQLVDLDMRLNDHVALEKDASAAVELFPTLPLFHLYRGIALSNLKRYDEAVESLVTGRDLVVDDNELLAQFWTSLGDTHHEAGQHAESDASYDKALALSPDNANTLNNYAYYLSLRGEQLQKAEKMSKRSNELAPGQSSYEDTYAWVLYRIGRFEEARTWIEKAMASGGASSGEVQEHYGDILFKLGDTSGALERWREAQRLGGASEGIDRKVSDGRLPD